MSLDKLARLAPLRCTFCTRVGPLPCAEHGFALSAKVVSVQEDHTQGALFYRVRFAAVETVDPVEDDSESEHDATDAGELCVGRVTAQWFALLLGERVVLRVRGEFPESAEQEQEDPT